LSSEDRRERVVTHDNGGAGDVESRRDIKAETDIMAPERSKLALQLGRAETEVDVPFWRVAEVDIMGLERALSENE